MFGLGSGGVILTLPPYVPGLRLTNFTKGDTDHYNYVIIQRLRYLFGYSKLDFEVEKSSIFHSTQDSQGARKLYVSVGWRRTRSNLSVDTHCKP